MNPLRIIINGMFTVEPLVEPLVFWMQQIGLETKIECAPYNQLFQQLLDPESLTNNNTNGFNIILICLEEWETELIKNTYLHEASKNALKHNTQELILALKLAENQTKSKFLICSCPTSPKSLEDKTRLEFYYELENLIEFEIKNFLNFSFVKSTQLLSHCPVNYYDEISQKLGHIPYTKRFFVNLATCLTRKIHFFLKNPCKAIILDYPYNIWLNSLNTSSYLTTKKLFEQLHKFLEKQNKLDRKIFIISELHKQQFLEILYNSFQLQLDEKVIIECKLDHPNTKDLLSSFQIAKEQIVFITSQEESYNTMVSNGIIAVKLPNQDWEDFLSNHWSFD